MEKWTSLNLSELQVFRTALQKRYDDYKTQNLSLDIQRGRPGADQLDLTSGMLNCLDEKDCKAANGMDYRNYGLLDGIPEAKALFAQMLEVSPKEIILGGNSSLNMMYDAIARAMTHGVYGSPQPWGKLPRVKFLCPSPGYDRHFAICEFFTIEMIPVEMKADGPDMDAIEKLVGEDEAIKGIWCVPKYSNPDGITYSDAVVERFAKMKTKAVDFRIFWDNAYVVHHLSDSPDTLKNILEACKEAGNADRVFIFSSTSKISFPGSGVAMMAGSENNMGFIKKQLAIQTIGPDKLNQLRHVRYFGTLDRIDDHMKKQAAILKPKFDAVLEILEHELGGKDIAFWNKPNGGYFISLNTMEGCARDVAARAAEAGVALTAAGATFPYGKDPLDKNIRIAPTCPPVEELKKAMEVLCICVQLAAAEKLIAAKSV